MATDEEIKKIVDQSLEAYRNSRVSKIFRNPRTAENAFFVVFMIGMISVMLNVLSFAVLDEYKQQLQPANDQNEKILNIAMNHMECEQLKDMLQEIEKTGTGPGTHTIEIQNQILSKC